MSKLCKDIDERVNAFGVTVPDTAAEVLGEVPDALAEASTDPF